MGMQSTSEPEKVRSGWPRNSRRRKSWPREVEDFEDLIQGWSALTVRTQTDYGVSSEGLSLLASLTQLPLFHFPPLSADMLIPNENSYRRHTSF